MLLGERVTPVCPLCGGPCRDPFHRGPFVFPDRLPQAQRRGTDPTVEPPPRKRRTKKRRGRPDRDAAVHGPERTTAVPGPERDR